MPLEVADVTQRFAFESMAGDTRGYAGSVLDSNSKFYRRLQTYRTAKADTYMREMDIRRIRTEAEAAWRKLDLDKLVPCNN